MSQAERKAKVDPTHRLPITHQCQLLSISRSSAYYQAKPQSNGELSLMKLIDALHLQYPFYGARRLRDALRNGPRNLDSAISEIFHGFQAANSWLVW